MKRIITFMFATMFAGQAMAQHFTIDNLNYEVIDVKKKYVSVSKAEIELKDSLVIPSEVRNNNIIYKVASIADSAFFGCSDLTSVTIPKSVGSIGRSAFYGCRGLSSITIPVSTIYEEAFRDCSGLTSIVILNASTIKKAAFSGCVGVKSITLPSYACGSETFDPYLSRTYNYPFGNIFGEYEYDGGVKTYQNYNYYYIPANLKEIIITGRDDTSIPDGAFCGCDNFTSVIIQGRVNIGKNAFACCSSLSSVIIENGKTIGEHAFHNCNALESVEISSSVELIEDEAFMGCTALKTAIIADSRKTIGKNVFKGCSSLASLTLSFNYSRYHMNDWYENPLGYLFGEDSYDGATATAKYCYPNVIYYIPDSLKEIVVTGNKIPDGAFYQCGNLLSITITNPVSTIGHRAFYSCVSLESLIISNSVKNIGQYAIDGGNLASITIPKSVSRIEHAGVLGGKNLTIYCEVESKPQGWSSDWNIYNRPVVWGNKIENNQGGVDENEENNNDSPNKENQGGEANNGENNNGNHNNENQGGEANNEGYGDSNQNKENQGVDNNNNETQNKENQENETNNSGNNNNQNTWNQNNDSGHKPIVPITDPVSAIINQINSVYNMIYDLTTDVAESAANEVNIYTIDGNTIIIENATEEIRVYDAMGKLICRDAINRVRTEICVNGAGLYIVKVGNMAKRVMVN